MPPKKKTEASKPGGIQALLERMAASGSRAVTATQLSERWRYLDFRDPKTGLPTISQEWLIGCRGFRSGTINQFRGYKASGKTSTMMLQYGASQLLTGKESPCVHIETEGSGYSPDRIWEFGVDPDMLLSFDNMNSIEAITERIDDIVCNVRGGFGGSIGVMGRKVKSQYGEGTDPDCEFPILIGIDSLSMLGSADKADTDVVDLSKSNQIAYLSVKMREWFRERAKRYEEKYVTLFLATHATLKDITGSAAMYGGPKRTSVAGDAIEQVDTVAIDFPDRKDWKDENDKSKVLGTIIRPKVFKNKLNFPGNELEMFLSRGNGFDMIHTDCTFLLDRKESPFNAENGVFVETSDLKPTRGMFAWRYAGKIKCPLLRNNKDFGSEEEFVRELYANEDVLMQIRQGLQIRGFNLPFETKYKDERTMKRIDLMNQAMRYGVPGADGSVEGSEETPEEAE